MCIYFGTNVPKFICNFFSQNVQIPPRSILPTHTFITLQIKIGSVSFFSSSDMHQFHHLSGCHATGINSSRNSILSYLRFLELICQAKSLVRIIVSGLLSSSKLSSRLILLRSILRIPISLQLNTASLEPYIFIRTVYN